MGILDALRGRKSGDNDDDEQGGDHGTDGGPLGPGDPAAPDPTNFQPRTDGSYVADGSRLLFGGGKVRETTDGSESVVRSGDFTSSGRFSVSAPFEMLVTFAVTEVGDDHFVARRTSVADRTSVELTYRFRPAGDRID